MTLRVFLLLDKINCSDSGTSISFSMVRPLGHIRRRRLRRVLDFSFFLFKFNFKNKILGGKSNIAHLRGKSKYVEGLDYPYVLTPQYVNNAGNCRISTGLFGNTSFMSIVLLVPRCVCEPMARFIRYFS